jgi:monoamine oxidase
MSKEILIIGAGACGLMAGKLLAERGHLVTIVEARNRVGGRIHTEFDENFPPREHGAEFVHGLQPLTLSLVKDSGASTTLLKGRWYQLRNGKIQKPDLFGSQWEEMVGVLNKLERDTDIASFLREHFPGEKYGALRESVNEFVEGYDAADTHRASAFALRDEWSKTDDDEQFRIDGGYHKIIAFLVDQLTDRGGSILLSTVVKSVQWSKGKVTLQMNDGGSIRGEKVIVTVPIGVLQNGDIQFSPALPFRNEIFSKLGNGGVIKFWFKFSERFWKETVRKKYPDVAFIISDAEIPTWWTQSPADAPVLNGWWGGPATFNVDHNSNTLREKALTSLKYILDCSANELEKAIVGHTISDWVADPYSRGAYTYATVSSEAIRNTLRTPVEDTIYFAGEALFSGTAMGTVEAALFSGRDVSKRISGLRGKDGST